MSISIAWVTPYGKKSDVSAFSRNVLVELARAVEELRGSITIFVNQNGADYWTSLPMVGLTGEARDREILSAYDFVIFNIGNNSGNHCHINWLATEVPGIVIVHDMVMQHFLAGEIFDRFHQKNFYARLTGEYYGESGLSRIGQSKICNEAIPPIYAPWDTLHVADMPLLEPFIQCAAAVIVHSAYAADFVTPRFGGPILRLALPWDQKPYLEAHDLAAWRSATINRTTCLIVCFGYIGRAKCLDLVIAAFAESPRLRNEARLIIAGYPGEREYTEELQTLVRAGGLGGVVAFEFSVSDAHLLELKQQADVFVNLRYPNTESASGSMVEQMNAGKPVLIYPTGCYAEIDHDAAIVVQSGAGAHAIAQALEGIVADPRARIRIGENGRNYVRRIGRREYVSALLAFLHQHEDLLRARKRRAVGQRDPSVRLDRSGENQLWLDGLLRTRRLFAELRRPDLELAVWPFLSWDNHTLIAFVVIGLFGQSPGSAFEIDSRSLLSRGSRADFYLIVGNVKIICLMAREDQSGGSGGYREILPAPLMLCGDAFILLRALGDEVLARSLYIGILGRRPDIDEVSAYVKRLAHEPIERIVREFLASDEFGRRDASHAAIDQLLEWCDHDHLCASCRPNLEIGQTLRFAADCPECRHYLGAGWHQLEDEHVWSRNAISTLIFSVAEEFACGELCLAITGRVAEALPSGARVLRFSCNGAAEVVEHVNDHHWFSLELELVQLSNAGNDFVVLLDVGSTVTPAMTGADLDDRALGFCLQSISLRRRI